MWDAEVIGTCRSGGHLVNNSKIGDTGRRRRIFGRVQWSDRGGHRAQTARVRPGDARNNRPGARIAMSVTPTISPTEFQCLKYDVTDHIALITLNRPERRNALNRRAYDEVESAFSAALYEKNTARPLAA